MAGKSRTDEFEEFRGWNIGAIRFRSFRGFGNTTESILRSLSFSESLKMSLERQSHLLATVVSDGELICGQLISIFWQKKWENLHEKYIFPDFFPVSNSLWPQKYFIICIPNTWKKIDKTEIC